MWVVINEGHNVLHEGETYAPGSVLDLPDDDAKVLIKGGVASRASRTTSKDTKGSGQKEEPAATPKKRRRKKAK